MEHGGIGPHRAFKRKRVQRGVIVVSAFEHLDIQLAIQGPSRRYLSNQDTHLSSGNAIRSSVQNEPRTADCIIHHNRLTGFKFRYPALSAWRSNGVDKVLPSNRRTIHANGDPAVVGQFRERFKKRWIVVLGQVRAKRMLVPTGISCQCQRVQVVAVDCRDEVIFRYGGHIESVRRHARQVSVLVNSNRVNLQAIGNDFVVRARTEVAASVFVGREGVVVASIRCRAS